MSLNHVYNFKHWFYITSHSEGLLPKVQKHYDNKEAKYSCRPTNIDNTRMRELWAEDQYSTTRVLCRGLGVCDMSISRATCRIDWTYKFNLWVTYELTQADKNRHVQAYDNLENQSKDKVLDQIVICDEKWIYMKNTSQKQNCSVAGEDTNNNAKCNLTNKDTSLCIWWSWREIIYKGYLEINTLYSEMLFLLTLLSRPNVKMSSGTRIQYFII